jgi:hypothetical protein
MAAIKSALELALERTASIKGDKDSIKGYEAEQKGKKLANEFLAGGTEAKFLEDALKKAPKDEQKALKQGLFEALLQQLMLPATKDDAPRTVRAAEGLAALLSDRRFSAVADQFKELIAAYVEETSRFEEAIKQQYAPKLQQKEEEIARRLGTRVKLDPFQDPEFVAFFNQNMDALKQHYQGAIDQVKKEAAEAFK